MLMQPDTPAARSFVLLKCSWVGRGGGGGGGGGCGGGGTHQLEGGCVGAAGKAPPRRAKEARLCQRVI